MSVRIDDPTLLHSPRHALVGRVIADKFCLREVIGAGANGSVYRADQSALGRTVAVKVMRPEIASDPRFIRKFHDEARAASRLNHPNVVSVIDFGQTDDGLLYLVMEFLRGITLTDVMRQERLSIERIGDIMTQILSALEEAHEGGVVHADLKTDNTMVERRRGGWDLVKVVDFGIARLTGRLDEDDIDGDDSIFGTPEYMAPEIIRGDDPTPATDIYAVGVILYELLVGRTPFGRQPTLAILESHLSEIPPPPSRRAPMAVPAYLEKAVMRALEKRPADRFVNANAFARALVPPASTLHKGRDEQNCGHCGTTSPGSFKFCPQCGTASVEEEAFTLDFGEVQKRTGEGAKIDKAGLLDLEKPPKKRSTKVPTQDVRQALARATLEAKSRLFPLPLVGREKELSALSKFASAPKPGTMVIRGPLGSGRTRLLMEACQLAVQKDSVVYIAPADPSGQATPFYPIRSMVAAILQLPPSCSYVQLGEAIRDFELSERDLPGIGELFQQEGGGIWELEKPIRRREVFAATMRLMHMAGEKFAAILAFADCHLYDAPSQELVRVLCEGNHRSPSLRIIATADESTGMSFAGARELQLTAFGEDSLRAIVSHLESCGQQGLVTMDELQGRDTPAHIDQLVHYADESGDLSHCPEGLADLIAARTDLLPQVAKRVLQAAAVFGLRVVESDLVAALASSVGRIEMDASLKLLCTRNLLRREDGMLCIATGLVREVIYEATPLDVRRTMHHAVGDTLKASTSDPAILGWHAERAGDLWRASELLSMAGERAVRQFDEGRAAILLNRALIATRALLQTEPDQQTQVQLVHVSILLAQALQERDEVGLAKGILNEARGLCRDTPALRVRLHRAEANLLAADGNLPEAIAMCRASIAMALRIFELELLTECYLDLATMLLRKGESAAATQELEESIDVITAGEGPTATRTPSQFWRLLLRLGQLLAADGHMPKARRIVESALRLAQEKQSKLGVARANMTLASILEATGETKVAKMHRRVAIDDMRNIGDRRATAELLLAGASPTGTIARFDSADVAEARLLAEEVGWDEGAAAAKSAQVQGEN